MVVHHAPIEMAVVHEALEDGGGIGSVGGLGGRALVARIESFDCIAKRHVFGGRSCRPREHVVPDGAEAAWPLSEGLGQGAACALEVSEQSGWYSCGCRGRPVGRVGWYTSFPLYQLQLLLDARSVVHISFCRVAFAKGATLLYVSGHWASISSPAGRSRCGR